MRFRGRSFLALVLAPEKPIADWLADLDAWSERSPSFFAGRPVILDLAGLELGEAEITDLLAELAKRDIRIMALEGVEAALDDTGLPPVVNGGRKAGYVEVVEKAQAAPAKAESTALVLDAPLRSGQSVIHPAGDVVVIGSVGSGAEIVAGGSIHIYGALRGRAIAGSTGNARARIFCRRFEAELIAIDGLYRTSDNSEPGLAGRPVHAWLEGETIMLAALDEMPRGG